MTDPRCWAGLCWRPRTKGICRSGFERLCAWLAHIYGIEYRVLGFLDRVQGESISSYVYIGCGLPWSTTSDVRRY